jgi:hypothetical protein
MEQKIEGKKEGRMKEQRKKQTKRQTYRQTNRQAKYDPSAKFCKIKKLQLETTSFHKPVPNKKRKFDNAYN